MAHICKICRGADRHGIEVKSIDIQYRVGTIRHCHAINFCNIVNYLYDWQRVHRFADVVVEIMDSAAQGNYQSELYTVNSGVQTNT